MAAPEFIGQNLYVETAASLERPRKLVTRLQFDRYLAFVQCALDIVTNIGAFLASCLLNLAFSTEAAAQHTVIEMSAMAACFATIVAFLQIRDRPFCADSGLLQIRESERIIRTSAQSLLLLWGISFLLQLHSSASIFLVTGLVAPSLLIFQRQFLNRAVSRLRRHFGSEQRVLVYGGGENSRSIISVLLESPRCGLRPIAVLEGRNLQHAPTLIAMGYRGRACIPVLTGILTPDLLHAYRTDLLLIVSSELSPERIAAAKDAAKLAGTPVAYSCNPTIEEQRFTRQEEIDGMQFSLPVNQAEPQMYVFAKRLMDIMLSAALLLLFSPVFVAIALLIRLDSPGPAFFIQERVGLNGSLFSMFKFRTMYASSSKYELSPTSSRDWRITCIGRALRRTGLDELPQLINVFLGDMSFVGPRPEMPFIVEHYTPEQFCRLQVIPGITGIWQLSADRAFPIHQNIQYDFYYIRNRTLCMDIAIMAHTLVFAMRGGI